MNNKAVFAGTFDPFTLGHYEIAERASKQFTTLYVAVADGNQAKTCRYNIKKRVRIAQLSLGALKKRHCCAVPRILGGFHAGERY